MIDLIRNRQAGLFLFDHRLDQLGDVLIARVRDDGLRVIVQFILDRGDDLLELIAGLLAELEAGEHLLVALEQLDCKPAAVALLGHVADEVGDLRKRVLDLRRERVLRGPHACGRRLFGSRHQLGRALALERGGFDDRYAQLGGQLFGIDRVAALGDNIHHVERDDDRNADLEQLGRQIQIAFDVGSIHQVDNDVRLFVDQEIAGDDLLKRVRRERVNTRQVGDRDLLVRLIAALLFFHGNARPVADVLRRTGQVVEHRGLAAVRVTGKRQTNRHVVSPFYFELASANLISCN